MNGGVWCAFPACHVGMPYNVGVIRDKLVVSMVKSLTPQISKKPSMPRGQPFQKGRSGNPGGRPRRTQEEVDLIEACRSKTPEALGTILQLMHESDNDRVKLAAAQYVIERGWGKAPERIELLAATVDLTAGDDMGELSPLDVYLQVIKGGRIPVKNSNPSPKLKARTGLMAILDKGEEVRL